MKIREGMSDRQRKTALNDVARKAHDHGCSLAGGYVRDYDYGVIPKDIDLFKHIRALDDKPALLQMAQEILVDFGQEIGPNDHLLNEYGEGKVVVKSAGPSDDYEAIDIVFHSYFNEIHFFDLACCKIRAIVMNRTVDLGRSWDYRMTKQTGYEVFKGIHGPRSVEHFLRIKDKLGIKAKVDPELGGLLFQQEYDALVAGGLFEDARQVLQTQRQEVAGDQVRLNGGVANGRAILNEWVRVQAEPNRVHNPAQVQPGFQVFNWVEPDINRG